MTVGYRLGPVGKAFKNVTVTLTGQNLLVLTGFTGFDPEVNVDKSVNGIPSRESSIFLILLHEQFS